MKQLRFSSFRQRLNAAFLAVSLVPLLLCSALLLQIFRLRMTADQQQNAQQQLDGACEDVLDLGDMVDKFEAFGWFTRKVNGHDVDAILEAIEAGKAQSDRPVMIILDTVKGHGCLLAEETFPCHHMKFTPEQIAPSLEHAQAVLDAARKA